jgi:hypothetical protein
MLVESYKKGARHSGRVLKLLFNLPDHCVARSRTWAELSKKTSQRQLGHCPKLTMARASGAKADIVSGIARGPFLALQTIKR